MDDAALANLYKLKQLRGLDLSYSFISDQGVELLRPLTTLTFISVDSRLITDIGLKTMSPLTRLVALDIYGCKVIPILHIGDL